MEILITGGSGGIGLALIEYILATKPNTTIYATYRHNQPTFNAPNLHWFRVDVCNESDIMALAGTLPKLDAIINTVGLLHHGDKKPEKSVSCVESDFFALNIYTNTLPTILLAKHLYKSLKSKSATYFISFSARIGSIDDNKVGGWLSYRCSKAALNMAIKTISIEWQYKRPNCCVFSFHPGTTDTPLSAPFQKNVPPEKLFSAQFVAQSLITLMERATPEESGKFFSYDGSEIPW